MLVSKTKTRRDAFLVERGEGQPIQVFGNDIRVKISSRDTAGAFTVFEGRMEPLEGPPLHLHHDQDESWYILEGEFRFAVDGKEIYGCAGDTVFAPRGSRHTFQNIGNGPGRLVTTVVPGGLDVFFEEVEATFPRGTVPDPAKLFPIFQKHGLELLGPPLAAMPDGTASAAD